MTSTDLEMDLNTLKYTIYKITCKVNGKTYIGLTANPIEQRFSQHMSSIASLDTKFARAIRKHGRENFYIEPIETCVGFTTACDMEKHYIKLFNSFESGYNGTQGGRGLNGVKWTEERTKKMQESLKVHYESAAPEERMTKMETRKLQSKVRSEKKLNPVTIDGVEYNSIRDASRKLNTSFFKLKKYIETGVPYTEAKLHPVLRKYVVTDALVFDGAVAAAEFFGVTRLNLAATIKRYKDQGILEEMIEIRKRQLVEK